MRFAKDRPVWIVTADMSSMYTCLPSEEGGRILQYLGEGVFPNSSFGVALRRMLAFVLENNYLSFNGKVYHQVSGTAMGTPCAPSYANLFVGARPHAPTGGHPHAQERRPHWIRRPAVARSTYRILESPFGSFKPKRSLDKLRIVQSLAYHVPRTPPTVLRPLRDSSHSRTSPSPPLRAQKQKGNGRDLVDQMHSEDV
mgnify:FL=1